jgi:hypothetical protein
MFNKKIEEFIKSTGDGVVLDYVNGQFILENKSFVEGKPIPAAGKVQAKGKTIEDCVDNFVYAIEQKEIYDRTNVDSDDIESYRWYCSY